MIQSIRTTVALGPTANREVIETACGRETGITLSAFVQARAEELAHLSSQPHDALVVACAGESHDVLTFISGAVAQRPGRPVVVVYEGTANGFVHQAFDAGAADLINSNIANGSAAADGLGREIAFALEKAIVRGPSTPAAPPAAAPQTRGAMIA
ncbi:MAG: hypothetical protein QOK10_873, partial [Pseudonocardiales bacterium]|nr:hypothetical protein [Pseudonocardiales bacterium]